MNFLQTIFFPFDYFLKSYCALMPNCCTEVFGFSVTFNMKLKQFWSFVTFFDFLYLSLSRTWLLSKIVPSISDDVPARISQNREVIPSDFHAATQLVVIIHIQSICRWQYCETSNFRSKKSVSRLLVGVLHFRRHIFGKKNKSWIFSGYFAVGRALKNSNA